MVRTEVRCCCDAHLIGWIEGDYELGETYEFPIQYRDEHTGKTIDHLSLEAAAYRRLETVNARQVAPNVTVVQLEGGIGKALKSRDYPIEQMRQIPGFVEAPQDAHDPAAWQRLNPELETPVSDHP